MSNRKQNKILACPLCEDINIHLIYRVENIPIFQNKVYSSRDEARKAAVGDVSLMACNNCDFVFNSEFIADIMSYDDDYQNEQALSAVFNSYLEDIIEFFRKKGFAGKKILEIGCGKGFFLEKISSSGFDVMGIDPAYEGDHKNIIKDYYSEKYKKLNAELIILRHTLEHIADPLRFLHGIAQACDYNGKIFIEVPSLEWIFEKNAFWDIFYEHCNYFTMNSLTSMFETSEHGFLFNGQYMFVLADLKALRRLSSSFSVTVNSDSLSHKSMLKKHKNFVSSHKSLAVWGAGAKGSTFANLMDPGAQYIDCLVDINPMKQGKFVAKTGHKIISPEVFKSSPSKHVMIMNDNYYQEIVEMISNDDIDCYTLE